MATEMAEGCRLLTSGGGAAPLSRKLPRRTCWPFSKARSNLRVESREAIPRLAAWLAEAHGVMFLRETAVTAIEMPQVHTSRGMVRADRVAVCPGDDFSGLYADRLGAYELTRCKLQMLRLADPGFRLPAAIMSDLGLGRYRGYADLDAALPLKARLAARAGGTSRNMASI